MKKVISYLLLVITVMTCTVPYLIKSTEHVSAASSAWKSGTVITSAKGKDYTSNEALAGKLDNIFAGHISIYTDSACKNEKVAALGTYSVVPENKFYIGTSYYTGESCYAYANGVYYTLFNEIAGHHGSSSVEIGISTISESAFNAGGVNNAPGAYIVMGTHKQILLGYNSDSITIVDGNNDANGYVCIRKFTWSDYESLTRHYAGSSNITVIQRKDYWSIYPIDTEPPVFSSSVNAASLMCMEDGEDGFTISFDVTDNYGVTTCYANIWEYGQTENDAKKIDLSPDSNGHVNAAISTSLFDGFKGIYNVKIYAFDAVGNCAVGELNPETPINLYESNPQGKIVGTYSAVKDNVPVREAPYSKVNGKDTKVASISKDTKVAIIGIYVNDFENDWYQLDNGNWIYSENLKKVSAWNRYIERLNQIAQKGMYQFFWGQPIYSSNTSHGGGAAAFSAANGLVKAGQDYIYAAIDLITSSYRASNGSTGNSFVIEFNANGGSCYTRSKIVSEGASYGWLPTPSRYGYTFDGWFTDATAGEHVTESTVAISGSVLYAHWTRIILASGQCGDNLKYTLYGDGELCITGSGEMSSHPWTSNYAGRIADVNLPDGLTNICNNAFYQCTGIVAIEIPDTVTEIGSSAFDGCLNLTVVSGMKNVTKIESSAFYGCKKLSNIELPLSLTELGYGVFRCCTSLTKIKIPKSLSSCGEGIFRDCTNIKEVEFETGITKIPYNLFDQYSDSSFGLETIEIPDTVTEIGSSAFYGCLNLTTVSGMKNVTKIESSAFYGCKKLSNIELPLSLTELGYGVFRCCTSLTKIKIPKSLSSCGEGIFRDCTNIKEVEFETGITKIPYNLFDQYSDSSFGLETIEIPDTVTEIGSSAFYGCLNLTTVSGMKNVTKIESSAFYGCKKLSNIELPLSLTELGNGVFSYCTSLETTSVPSSLNTWGYGIYRGCTSLKSVTIPEGFMNIPSEMFMNCSSLTDIALPTTMKVIRSSAFEGSGLTNITLPYGCTEVQASAFKNSVGLISANIPDSVTSLGSSIFEGCSSLTDVNLGRNISSIPQNAFKNCESLKKLVVPYYTTEIGNNAFNNDTAFTEITIPRNVTSISSTAFSYPDKLTIYGVPGTYAETYAGNNGIKFVGRESNAKEVKLNTSQITINKEDSYQLNMTVTPADYTDQIIWKSSDTSVATVSEKGIVKGIKGGTTTIKLTVGNVSTSCSVTVLQPVTSIYVNSNPTLGALETYQLSASVYPSDANNKTLIWTSSDTAVATVSNTGLVTAIGRGTATITATATDGSEVYDTCIVTVKNNLIISNDVDSMECEHNYFDNCSDIWQYTSEGAKALDITFDSRTYTESGFDYIYIMDKDNTVVGEYTGNELASHTVRVNGDTVRIKLVSDGSGTEWGFKVTKIAPVTSIHAMEFISTKEATCTDEGHNAYYHCKDCGKFFKDENGTIEMTQQEVTIPALGHDWVYSQTVEPTYTDDGYTLYICSRCDETKKSDYTDKLILKYPELTSASNTTSGIQLKWSKVTDATGYILYRKTGNGSWSRIADIKNGSTVSYIDKTAKSGTTYTYTIRAYSGKYMSDWKTTKTIKRLADPTVSSASNITAGVQVKWSKVTGATGYIVYRKTGKGSWSRVADIKSGSTVSYTDKTAKSGTTYTYTVRAYSGSTMGDWSSTKTVKRLADPTVSSTSNITAGVQVKWAKVTGATGYIVYRKTGNGSWSRLATIKSGSTTGYTDKSAKSGTNYSYTVCACNGTTMSDWHNSKAVKRLSNPAVTSASKTSNGINVKWSKVTGATGYVVYRKTAKGSWSRIANIKSGSTTSYTDTKASRGVTYTYTVRAYNGSTMSSFNSTKSAKR